MQVLKLNVIKSLKKAEGTPINELMLLFDNNGVFSKKMSKLFGEEVESAEDLIDVINQPNNFDKIFEVVN